MDGLVGEGRLIVIDRVERLRGRQADDVAGAVVAGHTAAEFDLGGDRVQQRAARRGPNGGIDLRSPKVGLGAICQLLGVKNRVGLQVAQHPQIVLGRPGRRGLTAVENSCFVEDGRRALGSLHDRRADAKRLTEGEPVGRGIAAHGPRERQQPGIAAGEGLAVGAQRQAGIGAGDPRLPPGRNTAFDARDEIGHHRLKGIGHGILGGFCAGPFPGSLNPFGPCLCPFPAQPAGPMRRAQLRQDSYISPNALKLATSARPTTTWSCTATPRVLPPSTTFRVISMSAADGV